MVPERSDEASGSAALASLILHLSFKLVNQQSTKSKHKTGTMKQAWQPERKEAPENQLDEADYRIPVFSF